MASSLRDLKRDGLPRFDRRCRCSGTRMERKDRREGNGFQYRALKAEEIIRGTLAIRLKPTSCQRGVEVVAQRIEHVRIAGNDVVNGMPRYDRSAAIHPELWAACDVLAQNFRLQKFVHRRGLVERVPGFSARAHSALQSQPNFRPR